jgi:hypothetical protein
MLELTSNGKPVHLTPGTSVQLELNSPLFDEDTIKGSFSYSFTVPAGPNGQLYGWPERPDCAGQPGPQLPAALADDGLPLLTGVQRLKSATASKYNVGLQGGLSGAQLSERQLSSFSYGGTRLFPRQVYDGLDGGGNPQYKPGLQAHANDVVANPADYDYVFAPLRNEYLPTGQAAPTDPLDYYPCSVNCWLGTGFQWNTVQLVMGLPPAVGGGVLNAYCPFPRLRYVLRAILEESGLLVDAAQLLPGPLGELVLVSNAWLVDRGDWYRVGFSLADVVPALTVAELLAALRQDLGVVVYVDARTQRARTAYLVERVAASAAYVDLTTRLAGSPEVSIADDQGLTLTYHVDDDEALSKDMLSKQPDPALVLPAVPTVADLPAVALMADNPARGQVRLVEDRGTYYECTPVYLNPLSASLTWTELPNSLPTVAVNGGGEEQAQHLCYTTTRPTRMYSSPLAPTFPAPAISQAPYQAQLTTVKRSSALRLLFYNGLQLASDGTTRYPQLAMTNAAGTHSLRLTGSTGTYAQWLRAWLPVKLRGASYKYPLLLTSLDLSQLDLTRQVWLDGVAYLVRKLSATVPLKKAATAELVRL